MQLKKQLPVFTPLRLMDFWRSLSSRARGGSDFSKAFGEMMEGEYCYPVSSGRAALCTALQALKAFSDRNEVIIPAYTCPTVPLSVARAGLKVKLCDIDLQTFNMDLNSLGQLVDRNTLAIVVAHFYGFPCDMRQVISIAGQNGTSIVEDAAQSTGARYNGKRLGTLGDIGCFSLNRGKCFTTYNGGILITDNQRYAREIESRLETLGSPNSIRQIGTFLKLLGMHFCSWPRLWWFISKLPLGFEPQQHSINFEIEKLPNWQAAFGRSVLERLDEINAVRAQNGEYLMQEFKGMNGLRVPQIAEGAEPVYLRFPVLIEDAERRNSLYDELHKRGISVSKMYAQSLNEYEYLRDIVPETSCPNAEYVAERILMLPTHPLMSKRDLDIVMDVFRTT